MKGPTRKEVLELVEFDRDKDGNLRVREVRGSVWGSVEGSVLGNIRGSVEGSVEGNVLGSIEGNVLGNVQGSIQGNVWGNIRGSVEGRISGREWQYVETPKERAIRLIREGKGEEAIKVLEGEG